MSSLVFVLGLLLALGGAASIYSGYGIVEIERGWTAVIAGSTALSAGIMTIGIAFVLRCLLRLQAFLEAEKGFLPLLSELALHQTRQGLRQSYAHAANIEPGAPADDLSAGALTVEEAATEITTPAEVSIDDIRRIVAARALPEFQSTVVVQAPGEDDASAGALKSPIDVAAPIEGNGSDHLRRITGRYESDGTRYIMYSDGSIDANSERGAFHFGSLAELKSFMESRD
jgi:hypothetical protein